METATKSSSFEITKLNAINVAKVVTIICLATLAWIYGINDYRQIIYLCLHISYCLWWLLEQWLFPQRRQQLFTEKVGILTLIIIILFVGVFYSLPGYLAFTNANPVDYLSVAMALPLYIFGSLINTGADVQKMTAKSRGSGLVQDGIWRSLRHVNYLGDLMRYTSFSVIAGSLWAFVLPGVITLLYIQRINQKEKTMAAKYSEFSTYQQNSSRLLPWIW
jgi:protein-S-isoprenylcysteine O-methyltransferase Ste14